MHDDDVRIDKWLWAARFFKTRALACDAIETGHVRVAGERVKPSRGVKVGDRVSKGQTILLVEAMKTFNQIHAPNDGVVKQILVGNADPVEFNQPLMIIE